VRKSHRPFTNSVQLFLHLVQKSWRALGPFALLTWHIAPSSIIPFIHCKKKQMPLPQSHSPLRVQVRAYKGTRVHQQLQEAAISYLLATVCVRGPEGPKALVVPKMFYVHSQGVWNETELSK